MYYFGNGFSLYLKHLEFCKKTRQGGNLETAYINHPLALNSKSNIQCTISVLELCVCKDRHIFPKSKHFICFLSYSPLLSKHRIYFRICFWAILGTFSVQDEQFINPIFKIEIWAVSVANRGNSFANGTFTLQIGRNNRFFVRKTLKTAIESKTGDFSG